MKTERVGPVQPWWRIRMVWLAFGGPVLVVMASFLTLYFAVHGRDLPLRANGAAEGDTSAPAMQARNLVVTPHRQPR